MPSTSIQTFAADSWRWGIWQTSRAANHSNATCATQTHLRNCGRTKYREFDTSNLAKCPSTIGKMNYSHVAAIQCWTILLAHVYASLFALHLRAERHIRQYSRHVCKQTANTIKVQFKIANWPLCCTQVASFYFPRCWPLLLNICSIGRPQMASKAPKRVPIKTFTCA